MVQQVSDSLAGHLVGQDFGGGVRSLFIGFICERVVPGFESFAREVRSPQYERVQRVELIGGGFRDLQNTFTFDAKLDEDQYERFVGGTEQEALGVLVHALLESLVALDQMPEEVTDFDRDAFRSAVAAHLRSLEEGC
ncbi:MAG: hypothetical protein QNK05_00225 [Myxococcota bacterium]|nr:hypothetical protein [Myxococcota bacterium]